VVADHRQVDAQVVAVEPDRGGVFEARAAEDGDVVVVRVAPGPDRPAEEVGLVVPQHVLELRDLGGLGEGAQRQRRGEQSHTKIFCDRVRSCSDNPVSSGRGMMSQS